MHLQYMSYPIQCFEGGWRHSRFEHDAAAELLAIVETQFFHRGLNHWNPIAQAQQLRGT